MKTVMLVIGFPVECFTAFEAVFRPSRIKPSRLAEIARISVVLLLASLAGAGIGCASMPYNMEYAGERFPAEHQIIWKNIVINEDGGAKNFRRLPADEENVVLDSIVKKLQENGFGFKISQGSSPKDFLGADATADMTERLYSDAHYNIKTGKPSQKMMDSPVISMMAKIPQRYVMLLSYNGYYLTESYRNKLIALNAAGGCLDAVLSGLNPNSGVHYTEKDANDLSTMRCLIFDNAEKKYVFIYIRTYNVDPRYAEDLHLNDYFETLKKAREAKPGK